MTVIVTKTVRPIITQKSRTGVVVEREVRPIDVTVEQRPIDVTIDKRPIEVRNIGMQGPPGAAGGTIAPIHFAYGDASSIVWVAPASGVLTDVSLDITAAFNGTAPAVSIGTNIDPGAAMAADQNDPTLASEYQNTANIALVAGQGVRLTITPAGATTGAGVLYLTFIPN